MSEEVVGMVSTSKQFDAFISYRRLDGSVAARWIRKSLLSYRVPSELRMREGKEYPKLRVYRDEAYERAAEDFFERNIEPALRASKALILVATPSILEPSKGNGENWVEREIRSFLLQVEAEEDDERSIIVVRAKGDIDGKLPDFLSARYPRIQQLDFRGLSPLSTWWPPRRSRLRDSVVRIAAEIYGIETRDLPMLLREEERRQQRTLLIAVAFLTVVAVIISTLAGIAWFQRGQAIARAEELKEQLITTVAATHPDALLGALLLPELGEDPLPIGAFDAAVRVLDSPLPYALTEAVRGSIERRPSYSDDGKRVVIFSDEEVLVADVSTGRTIRRFFDSGIYDVRLSPSGETVVTLSKDGTVRAHPLGGPSRVIGKIQLDLDVDHWIKIANLESIEFDSTSDTFYWPEQAEYWHLDGRPAEASLKEPKQFRPATYYADMVDSTGTARLIVTADSNLVGRAEIVRLNKAAEWETKAGIDFEMNDSNTKRLDIQAAIGPNGEYAFLVVTSVNPEFIGGDQHFTARYTSGNFRKEDYVPSILAPDGRHAAGTSFEQAWLQPDCIQINAPLVKQIAFSPSGQQFVTLHADGHARLWDVDHHTIGVWRSVGLELVPETDVSSARIENPTSLAGYLDLEYGNLTSVVAGTVAGLTGRSVLVWKIDRPDSPLTLPRKEIWGTLDPLDYSPPELRLSKDARRLFVVDIEAGIAEVAILDWHDALNALRAHTKAHLTVEQRMKYLGNSKEDAKENTEVRLK